MNTHPHKVISLFTGAMGLDLGLASAGFETIAGIENDKQCVATIRANKPTLPLYGDITKTDPRQVLSDLGLKEGELTLLVGGPPCQAFSTAGKRRGLEDVRGNLLVRYLEYLVAIRPKYCIIENVRGLLSAKLGSATEVFSEYAPIANVPGSVVYFLVKECAKQGYTLSFSLFDASFYGVPQKRERVIFFGTQEKKPVAIPPPHTKEHPLTLREAIGDLRHHEHHFVPLREKHARFLSLLKAGEYWKHLPEALQREAMGGAYDLQGGKTGFYRRLSWEKPAPTLVTHPAMPATMLVHPEELRPLSVEEYARIQQFPDSWQFVGAVTAVYKQIGNAVPVGLGCVAGKAIRAHAEGEVHTVTEIPTSRYVGNGYADIMARFEKREKAETLPFGSVGVF